MSLHACQPPPAAAAQPLTVVDGRWCRALIGYTFAVTRLVLHAWCYTLGVTRLLLHAWCYTLAVTRLVLHAWCYTLGVTRLLLHAWCYTLTRRCLKATVQHSALSISPDAAQARCNAAAMPVTAKQN
jgi:hypothetical protein